ncbi:unnamed protein product [Urochloa humidicola]
MYILSKKEPLDVTIKLTSGQKYKIPSTLFLTDLGYLRLDNCIISLPWNFKGFKWLVLLVLEHFSSTDSDINNLISSCPKLCTLRLKYFEGIKCLNIRAQVLDLLEVEGSFEELHLHAPNLVHAYLTLDETEDDRSVPLKGDLKSYLKQAFGSLTCIKALTVSNTFLMYLSKGCMLKKLPGVFDHLEKICIEGRMWSWEEVVAFRDVVEDPATGHPPCPGRQRRSRSNEEASTAADLPTRTPRRTRRDRGGHGRRDPGGRRSARAMASEVDLTTVPLPRGRREERQERWGVGWRSSIRGESKAATAAWSFFLLARRTYSSGGPATRRRRNLRERRRRRHTDQRRRKRKKCGEAHVSGGIEGFQF